MNPNLEYEVSGEEVNRTRSSVVDFPRKNDSYRTFIQERWEPFESPHTCGLADSLKKTTIVNEIVDVGCLINVRRWCTSIFMVNEHHPKTKLVFKSASELRQEEVRHLLNYKWMIHPFSKFCIYYQVVISMITIAYLTFVVCRDMALPLDNFPAYMKHKWIKFGFDLFETLRIIIDFQIGYLDEERMFIYMDKRLVARHHLRTYLIFDIISCIPSYTIFMFYFHVHYSYWRLLKWFSAFRIARIPMIKNTLEVFTEYWNLPVIFLVALQVLLVTFAVVLACTYFLGFLWLPTNIKLSPSRDANDEVSNEVMKLATDILIGVNALGTPDSIYDALCYLSVTIGSQLLQLWITAKFYVLLQRFLVLIDVGVDHYQQLAGYLRYKALPQTIRNDVYRFYEFRFQKRFYDEISILGMLSDNLRREIPQYRLTRAIERLKFIRVIPNEHLVKVAHALQMHYFCPGDIIFRCGNVSKCMYYIQVGRVALHDENNMEICHLEDGAFYGDVSVIIPQTHFVTMTAISNCRVLILRYQALTQILDAIPQPEIKEQVQETARTVLMRRKRLWVQYWPKDEWMTKALLDEDVKPRTKPKEPLGNRSTTMSLSMI